MKAVLVGGHLTPAESFLQRLTPDYQVVFFGRLAASVKDKTASQEEKVVTQYARVKFVALTVSPFSILSFLSYLAAFVKALKYLSRFQPKFLFSFGGYLSVPVCLAAWILGVPIFIHEQTRKVGLANKLIAPLAKKIFLAHKIEISSCWQKKAVVIGNLLRLEMIKSKATTRLNGLVKQINIHSKRRIIMVTGGNQGAFQINRLIFQLLPKLLEKYIIIHQTGLSKATNDNDLSQRFKNKLKPFLSQFYFPFDYLKAADMGYCLRKSDLVISRAGANTIWELFVLKKKAILWPLLTGGSNEQLLNARWLHRQLGAVVIKDSKTTGADLLQMIETSWQMKIKEQGSVAVTNATEKIIGIIKDWR